MIQRLDVVAYNSERALVCEINENETAKIQLESNLLGDGKIETYIVPTSELMPIHLVVGQIVLLKEEDYIAPQPRWKITKQQRNGKFVIVHANSSGQRAIVVNPSQISACLYGRAYEFPVEYPIEAREPALIKTFGGYRCRVLVSYDEIGDVILYRADGTRFRDPNTDIELEPQRPKDVNWIELPELIKQGEVWAHRQAGIDPN